MSILRRLVRLEIAQSIVKLINFMGGGTGHAKDYSMPVVRYSS